VELLALASSCEGDEKEGYVYTFSSPSISAELRVDYGMELGIKLSVAAQAAPIAAARLSYCEEVRTRNSQYLKFIEFIGHLESSREGAIRLSRKAGFRLVLVPAVSLSMFYDTEPWSAGSE